jgi:hypothetical protein
MKQCAAAGVSVALIVTVIAGCVQPGPEPTATRSADEARALIADIRAHTRMIGFAETRNFLQIAGRGEAFEFCGFVSSFHLPYSYEDPEIRWLDSVTEEECRATGEHVDVHFGQTEALGEVESPVTALMLAAPMERFVYLVIHEDCHDQFALPYGIEEPLCNLLAYHAMGAFSLGHFGAGSAEHAAMQRYVRDEIARTAQAITFYGQLEALYARHAAGELDSQGLLRAREPIFRHAEAALAREQGTLNNVGIANDMTYSRHYPLMNEVFELLGSDLARMVAFFKRVDAAKPERHAVGRARGIADEGSAGFIRAYEEAVVDVVRLLLKEYRGAGTAEDGRAIPQP